MVLTQTVLLWKIGNGLSRFDAFDEADSVRAAEAFVKEGFTSHHGLGRPLYGNRFPTTGSVTGHLESDGTVKPLFLIGYPERLWDRNQWVYTHYPPGPSLWCGLLAHIFGTERIWMWRLVPISFAFLSVTILYRELSRAFGADCGALITAACAILPMAITYMPALYYESYTYVLQLLQFSLIIGWLWRTGLRWWHPPALFLLGFIHGWLSFDFFFIVTFAMVPFWLLRGAEGGPASWRELLVGVAMPFVGFGAAHFLHLLQIAGELGGLRAAITELTRTAAERAAGAPGEGHFSYLRNFAQMSYLYIREFLRLYNPHFGPFLPIAILSATAAAAFRETRLTVFSNRQHGQIGFYLVWPGAGKLWPALLAALVVCLLWPIAMPSANLGNFHIYPRDFFFLYFILVLAIVRSLSVRRAPELAG